MVDGCQVPLESVGKAGFDQGAGGRYLLIPSGCDGAVPDGSIPLWSRVFVGYGLMRVLLLGRAGARERPT